MRRGQKYPPTPPTIAEIQAMIEATSERSMTGYRSRAMLYCLWRAGLRVGELVDLLPGDVTDAEIRVRNGKGSRSRLVPIDATTADVVAQWASRRAALGFGADRPLFCGVRDGQGLTTSAVRMWLKRLAAKAGVQSRQTPHQFRHRAAATVGSQLSLMDTARFLGHSTVGGGVVTLRYLSSLGGDAATIRSVRWE